MTRARRVAVSVLILAAVGCGEKRAPPRAPGSAPRASGVHGLWVWNVGALLDDPTRLLDACQAASVNEVYLAVTRDLLAGPGLQGVVAPLRRRGLRVEALMGDPTWSRPENQSSMLDLIDAVIAYDERIPAARFDAIHLDVEPHTLPQNLAPGAHPFLPDYIDGLGRARARAERGGLSVSADVPRMYFDPGRAPPGALARAAPRLFLMLYELHGRGGAIDDARAEIAGASVATVQAAYAADEGVAGGEMIVGVSVADYASRLPSILTAVDAANAGNPRYAGWAIHDFSGYAALVRSN